MRPDTEFRGPESQVSSVDGTEGAGGPALGCSRWEASGSGARRLAACFNCAHDVVEAEGVPGSVSRRRPDVTVMDSLLGDHRFTSLEEGLEEC